MEDNIFLYLTVNKSVEIICNVSGWEWVYRPPGAQPYDEVCRHQDHATLFLYLLVSGTGTRFSTFLLDQYLYYAYK